jgi:hypothetical protein
MSVTNSIGMKGSELTLLLYELLLILRTNPSYEGSSVKR